MMKRSLQTICPVFNSHRMVSEYIESAYVPAARSSEHLQADNYALLREMVAWKRQISQDWDKIAVKNVEVLNDTEAIKGKSVGVEVIVNTAGHHPQELKVELLHGPIDLWENFKVRHITRLNADTARTMTDGDVLFAGSVPLSQTGLYGYVVRITPDHPNLPFSQSFDLVHRG